jgi:hypothetical protein
MSNRYSLYSVQLNAALNLTQVDNWSIKPNQQRSTIIPGGSIDPAHIGIASAQPSITIGTRDFSALFASASISAGLNCSSSSTFIAQKRASGATFVAATTTEHITITCAKGFYYPTNITASQDDADGAMVEGEFIPLWNGSTDPVVINGDVAINSFSAPAFSSRYFLGPVYHGGAAVDGVTSVSVDPGIRYEAKAFSGSPYPTVGSIIAREPRLTFTVANIDAADELTSAFGSAISTGLIFYLQKGVASGTRVAAATETHVKITATSGDWSADDISISGNEDGSVTFSSVPTTALALVTNSAIP